MSYICSCCGQQHDELPHVCFDQPVYAQQVPEEERTERVELNSDLCIVDDDYFIRGVIEIPVHGQTDRFGIGVWISQKPENFQTYAEHFDSDEIGPFFGWLSNDFDFGGVSILSLKTMAHFRGNGLRPSIEVESTNHPLAIAQRDGMSLDEAWAFVHGYLDPSAVLRKMKKS